MASTPPCPTLYAKGLYRLVATVTVINKQTKTSLVKTWYKHNAPINSKVQHPPRAFELLKIGLFKFPPLGAKKPFNYPTN